MIKVKNNNNAPSFRGPSFTIVTYNVLADVCATSEMFPNCPSFALSWEYRRQNLLKEILQCDADIICLQEVQQNHFSNFFNPELTKIGYQGLFKEKQRRWYSPIVDGCATFYRGISLT
jgi:CCR4-NOT transcription complex subunit 6